MYKVLVAACFIALAILAGYSISGGDVTDQAPKDGVFIHVSAGPEDPHRVLMALQMATLMSEDKAVAVYLDIEAVKVFVKGASDIEMKPFPSAFTQLAALAEKGVSVMACPGCLAKAGIPQDSLMDGTIVAQKEKFFDFTDGRILSLDY